MSNSILNNRGNTQLGQTNGNTISPQLVQQFNQFKENFNGNPQNTVMNMLQRGIMSNAQFQQLSQMAQQFQHLMR